MKSASSLSKLASPFIKLLGSAALAVAAGDAATENTYLHDLLAVDKKMAVPLLNTLSSFLVNKTYDDYKCLIRPKDFGFEGELLKAYLAALNLTFHKLQERCIQKYPEISPETVKEFFIDLEYNYSYLQEHDNDIVTQRIIKAYVDTNESFFSTVIDILQLSGTSSEGKLLQFVAEEFSNELGRAFSKQLLKTEHQKARMGFLIYLSKENLQISTANQDTLQKVSQLLEGIAKNQQLGNHIQEEALLVQKLATEGLRQMGYALEEIKEGIESYKADSGEAIPLIAKYKSGH